MARKTGIPLWLWYVAIGGAIYYFMKAKAPAGPTLPLVGNSPGGLEAINAQQAALGSYVIH